MPHRCRTCTSTDLADLGWADPVAHYSACLSGPTRIYRCRDCNLMQRDPIPTADTLIEHYRSESSGILDYDPARNAGWQVALETIGMRSGNTLRQRLLDVGCHTGQFLSLLPTHIERYGIEADGAPADLAKAYHGVQIIAERIESVPVALCRSFEIVTLFDVLEHLPDPAQGILSALRLVKPGGLLMFSTADADAWTWSQLGTRHWYLQTGQHLSVLSRRYVLHLERVHGLVFDRFQLIPHTLSSRRERLRQTLELQHWPHRDRALSSRLVTRLMQDVSGFRALRHRQSTPWTMSLRDHLFVLIRAGA